MASARIKAASSGPAAVAIGNQRKVVQILESHLGWLEAARAANRAEPLENSQGPGNRTYSYTLPFALNATGFRRVGPLP